jgi:hypothetical protein
MANELTFRILTRAEALELRARFDNVLVIDPRVLDRAHDLYLGACGWNEEGDRIEEARREQRRAGYEALGFERDDSDTDYSPAWAV